MIQRVRERYWLLKYLKDLQGKEISGIVSSVSERLAHVYLPDYLLEVPVPLTSEMVIKEGDKISLTIQHVDPLRRKIVLIPQPT
jgi:exoribonuclease R